MGNYYCVINFKYRSEKLQIEGFIFSIYWDLKLRKGLFFKYVGSEMLSRFLKI